MLRRFVTRSGGICQPGGDVFLSAVYCHSSRSPLKLNCGAATPNNPTIVGATDTSSLLRMTRQHPDCNFRAFVHRCPSRNNIFFAGSIQIFLLSSVIEQVAPGLIDIDAISHATDAESYRRPVGNEH